MADKTIVQSKQPEKPKVVQKAKAAPEKDKPQKDKPQEPNAIQRWYRETIGELRKVSWPTTQEAWRLTKIVLAVMAAMSLLLGVLDLIFSWLIARLV